MPSHVAHIAAQPARLLALAALLLTLALAAPAAASTVPGDWQKGMNLTSWSPNGYDSSSAANALQDLHDLGTNRIVLTPTWYMDNPSSNTVSADAYKTPTDAAMASIMSRAHDLGMHVTVKPHVDVRDGSFRGAITPSDRAAWFDSYATMLAHYADIARDGGADTLVIGTELTSMSTDTDRFDTLIARARSLFSGTLTYAANWVDEAEHVRFWDRLDVVGIDAYMPLDAGDPPTVSSLEAAWAPHVQRITAVHEQTGKPVMFTELGYQSRSGAAANPSDATGGPDPQLQADAYAAALHVWSAVPWFTGISWWNWNADDSGQDEATSFTIAGKPAASVLRDAQGPAAEQSPIEQMGLGSVNTGVIAPVLAALMGLLCLSRRRPSGPPARPGGLTACASAAPSATRAAGRPVPRAPAQPVVGVPARLAACCSQPGPGRLLLPARARPPRPGRLTAGYFTNR